MFSILTLILIAVGVDCYDWCPLVKPNGTYRGLGIYRRFRDSDGNSDFIMYNRFGAEWRFDLHPDNKSHPIVMWDNTVKEIDDKEVVNRFGVYGGVIKKPVSATNPVVYISIDCAVKTIVNKNFSINPFLIIKLWI